MRLKKSGDQDFDLSVLYYSDDDHHEMIDLIRPLGKVQAKLTISQLLIIGVRIRCDQWVEKDGKDKPLDAPSCCHFVVIRLMGRVVLVKITYQVWCRDLKANSTQAYSSKVYSHAFDLMTVDALD